MCRCKKILVTMFTNGKWCRSKRFLSIHYWVENFKNLILGVNWAENSIPGGPKMKYCRIAIENRYFVSDVL